MRLTFLFGDVPHITAAIDLSEGRNITRTPVQQIWDYVEKELEEASGSLLDSYHTDPKNIGHITKKCCPRNQSSRHALCRTIR